MSKKHSPHPKKSGLTMVELILVSAYVALITTLFLIAFNPFKHISEARNAQRLNDLHLLISAVHQWMIDHPGEQVAELTQTPTEICQTNSLCQGMIDLSVLSENGIYLINLPVDPLFEGRDSTGYAINQEDNGRISVSAPHAERGELIMLTRKKH